ncbi:hypothetical protein DV736_g2254, partial [Chaetothyriales sp. CBS 134916]
MADDELAQIRAARLAQLRQQQTGQSAPSSHDPTPEDADRQKQAESEARSSILNQILEPDAADRLSRIRMVKESRAQLVEDRLIMIARAGQLRSKVTEDQLKQMLASLSEHEEKEGRSYGRVEEVRHKARWDDDDLDDLLNES